MKEIKIGGAGISGLTAAINLAKEGYNVKVFEQGPDVAATRHSDTQHLENWTSKGNILKILKDMNIKKNFQAVPVKKMSIYSPHLKKINLRSNEPLMYSTRRGDYINSVDYGLKKQTLDLNVDIKFNKRVKDKDVDVVAIGPKRVDACAFGINFDIKESNKVIVIFDNKLSPKCYSYFSIINNYATLTSTFAVKVKEQKDYLARTIMAIEKIHKIKIKNPKKFAGFVNFNYPKTAKKGNRLYVGEAAGFQDALFGFGMVYAFKSGYLAAKSIIEDKDYDKLWRKELSGILRTSIVNRYLFEKLDKTFGYETLINFNKIKNPILKLIIYNVIPQSEDARKLLRGVYLPSFSKDLLFDKAFSWLKERFKINQKTI